MLDDATVAIMAVRELHERDTRQSDPTSNSTKYNMHEHKIIGISIYWAGSTCNVVKHAMHELHNHCQGHIALRKMYDSRAAFA